MKTEPTDIAAPPPRPLKRLVPAPVLSLALLGLWLLLNRSLSAGHVVLGTVLALAIPLLTAGLRPRAVRMRNWAARTFATRSNMLMAAPPGDRPARCPARPRRRLRPCAGSRASSHSTRRV